MGSWGWICFSPFRASVPFFSSSAEPSIAASQFCSPASLRASLAVLAAPKILSPRCVLDEDFKTFPGTSWMGVRENENSSHAIEIRQFDSYSGRFEMFDVSY